MSSLKRDDNFIPNIAGVSDITYIGTVEPAIDPTDHSLKIKIQEKNPTSAEKLNPSKVYSFDSSGNLTQIDKTISSDTYRKTFTWTTGNLTDESTWIKL